MEEFITFEIANKLKEKGFKKKCFKHFYPNSNDWFLSSCPECCNYSSYVDAPTISQILKWLREEKKIFITVNIAYCYEDDENPFPTNLKMKPILKGYYYSIWDLNNLNDKNGHSKYFESPELAYLTAINEII